MSYTELDAWIDEKAQGDWPFNRWELRSLGLREGFDYFRGWRLSDDLDRLFHRLHWAWGYGNRDLARFETVLEGAAETVRCAIEHAEDDARSMWNQERLWLPVIDERLNGFDCPVQMVIESVDSVGPPECATELEIFCALGLWCIGEWAHYAERKDAAGETWSFGQVALATAESEFYRGIAQQTQNQEREVLGRSRKAAAKRHAPNRENKSKGRQIWQSRVWAVQADAERAISAECNITKEVAGRWVREFKRATVDSAVQRTNPAR